MLKMRLPKFPKLRKSLIMLYFGNEESKFFQASKGARSEDQVSRWQGVRHDFS